MRKENKQLFKKGKMIVGMYYLSDRNDVFDWDTFKKSSKMAVLGTKDEKGFLFWAIMDENEGWTQIPMFGAN